MGMTKKIIGMAENYLSLQRDINELKDQFFSELENQFGLCSTLPNEISDAIKEYKKKP